MRCGFSFEENFPSRREVSRDVELYEMEDPMLGAPSRTVENGEEILLSPGDSGSDFLNHGLDLLDTDSQDPLMR